MNPLATSGIAKKLAPFYGKKRSYRWCPRCKTLVQWQKVRHLGARAGFRACVTCGGRTRPAKPGKRSVSPKRTLKKLADGLWALIVRNKNGGACRYCGTRRGIQGAHIVSRRYHATRYRIDNGVPLCHGCHVRFTHAPIEWREVVASWFGMPKLEELEAAARAVAKTDYAAVVVVLTVEIRKRSLEVEAIKRRLIA